MFLVVVLARGQISMAGGGERLAERPNATSVPNQNGSTAQAMAMVAPVGQARPLLYAAYVHGFLVRHGKSIWKM